MNFFQKVSEIDTGSIPILVYEFPELDKLFLLPLGDLHWEATNTDRRLLERKVKEIQENGYYTLLIGDLFEMYFFDSLLKGETEYSLNEALVALKSLFRPIADRILAVIEGNHDRRIEKKTGFSIIQEFCNDLQIPLIKGQGILHIRVGKYDSRGSRMFSYAGLVTHGWGGGRTKGGKANKAIALSQFWNGIDFTIIGHLHDPMAVPSAAFVYDARQTAVVRKNIRNFILSAFLNYPLYAQRLGYPPSARIEYLLEFTGERKKGKKEIISHEREMR